MFLPSQDLFLRKYIIMFYLKFFFFIWCVNFAFSTCPSWGDPIEPYIAATVVWHASQVDFVFTFPPIINTIIVKWEVSCQSLLAARCGKKLRKKKIQSRHKKIILLLLIKSLPWSCDYDPGNSNFYDHKIMILKNLWSYNHDPWSYDHDPGPCWVKHDL